jgi:hypothetical protein
MHMKVPVSLPSYAFEAHSPNDPNPTTLKYYTEEAADRFAETMNTVYIPLWEENLNGVWDKTHWKVKPEPWVVKPLA